MKKILVLLFTILCTCGLAACTTTRAENETSTSVAAIQSQRIELTMIIRESVENGWIASKISDSLGDEEYFIPVRTGEEHYEVGDYIIVCTNGYVALLDQV